MYVSGLFYPYGAGIGDTVNGQIDDGSSSAISLLRPFVFFGRAYSTIYVNTNGHLTFDQPWYSYTPYQFPAHGGRGLIAPFWTDLDNRNNGVISYKQYSSGSVLTQATQNINQYFPQLQFTATSVLVATWDRVAYYPVSGTACDNRLPYYRIEGKNENRGSTRVAWTRMVRIFVYNQVLELVKDYRYQAKVNGTFTTTPFSLRNGSIQVYQSGFSVAVSTDFGLVVTYDAYSYVTINVPYDYQNTTCGLCGNFNYRPEDDYRTPSGQILTSDLEFANSWKAQGDTDPGCHNTQCSGLICAACTTAQRILYSSSNYCGILAHSTGPFASCHSSLSPQTFVENCVYDLCVGGGYQPIFCQALGVYGAQCQQQGIQLGQWRSQGFCEIPCPDHSHFDSQGTGCPATCSNPSAPVNCPLPNQESCVCDAGYVLSAGACVSLASCGCTFEGFYYANGQSVVLDENCRRLCTCNNTVMTCQNQQCGSQEMCAIFNGVRGCRPISYSTCWVEGPDSYHTFDGLTFSYPGACGLTLSRVMGLSPLPNFVVTVQKQPTGLHTFSRLLKFEAEGTQVSIEMGSGGLARVDGQLVALPFSVGTGRIRIYHSSVKGIIMETTFGVTVRVDWPHLIRITAPSTYNGTLGGLCGNLNGYHDDEFLSPVRVLLNDSQMFGDSWRDGSLSAYCVESTDIWQRGYYQNSSQFVQQCNIMASSVGPFTQCHSSLDPNVRIADCVRSLQQAGGAREAFCEALRGYAVLCQQNGVAVQEWRNITNCVSRKPVVLSRENMAAILDPMPHALPQGIPTTLLLMDVPLTFRAPADTYWQHGQNTFITTDFGLIVSYDGSWVVRITVPANYSGATCGLCGNFNGQRGDDFRKRSGAVASSAFEFGADWKVENDTLCSDGCGDSCSSCQNPVEAQAQCQVLKDSQGPLSFCHATVDPQAYFDDCVFDLCVSENRHDVLCRSIQTYVSACQSANVVIYPWRQNTTCRIDCPLNSHYELCGTDCGHTCASSIDAVCQRTCSEGCFCNEGYARSGGLCVPVEQCGCLYNGFYYQIGEQFWTPGCSQRCKCFAPNDLRCSSAFCSPTLQECTVKNGLLGCYNKMSSCMVWGDPHYITFDGAVITFQGTCSYEISQTCGNVSNSGLEFRVVATNMHRGNLAVSFVSAVDVWLTRWGQQRQITIGQNRRVKVDGTDMDSSAFQIGSLAEVHQEQNFVVVNASNKLMVYFDGRYTLSVKLGPSFHGSVCGMCGNNNGDPADDKAMPSGALTPNDNVFGNSWKSINSAAG
ncbi:hypothetical protein MHYP_G00308590 [Metynnis hypsauchen]